MQRNIQVAINEDLLVAQLIVRKIQLWQMNLHSKAREFSLAGHEFFGGVHENKRSFECHPHCRLAGFGLRQCLRDRARRAGLLGRYRGPLSSSPSRLKAVRIQARSIHAPAQDPG
jgi:hypothetical protein